MVKVVILPPNPNTELTFLFGGGTRLLIQYLCNYLQNPKAVSSIRNLRIGHATVASQPHNQVTNSSTHIAIATVSKAKSPLFRLILKIKASQLRFVFSARWELNVYIVSDQVRFALKGYI